MIVVVSFLALSFSSSLPTFVAILVKKKLLAFILTLGQVDTTDCGKSAVARRSNAQWSEGAHHTNHEHASVVVII